MNLRRPAQETLPARPEGTAEPQATASTAAVPAQPSLTMLVLGATGMVFGDIGTSPLDTLEECVHPRHGVPPTPDNACSSGAVPRVGALFGPIMVLWFATIGVLGGVQVVKHPEILAAPIRGILAAEPCASPGCP